MKIAGLQKESYNDYPGKVSSVVFTSGCNYNCGYCHNPELKKFEGGKISEEKIWNYLDSRKDWIEGIVISGGEPTMQEGLIEFAKKAKEKNLFVKLDTNGSNPQILKSLLEEKIIDYVAMDLKAPLHLYSKVIGKEENFDFRKDVQEGIRIVSKFPNYEYRTTLIPIKRRNDGMTWMTPDEVGKIAEMIYNSTFNNKHKYFLQSFKAIEKKNGNGIYLKKNLPKKMQEIPKDLMEEGLIKARVWLPKTEIR